jgi:hypothetical protein
VSRAGTTVQPESGQYVAVWVFNERPWSATFRYNAGHLEEYDTFRDVWSYPNPVPARATLVRYYTAK